MTRLPLLGLLFLLFASQAFAQPTMIRSAFNPTRAGVAEKIPVRHLANEKPDTTHYMPITTVKNDFVVNSGNELYGANEESIEIVTGPDGAFLCAWVDHRLWSPSINAQLFDRDGNRIGSMIRISDSPTEAWEPPGLVFNDATNEYIVVWQADNRILLQRLSAAGMRIGVNTVINDSYMFGPVMAAADQSGNIYILWRDFNGLADLPYCQVVSKDGTVLTQKWSPAADDTRSIAFILHNKSITTDSAGRCMVVWDRYHHDYPQTQIMLQSVNRNGNVFAQPLVVSDTTKSIEYLQPAIASTKDGYYFIVWSSDTTLYGRVFHPDSGFVTPPVPIADAVKRWDAYQYPYTVSSDDAGRFFVIWNNNNCISGQTFSVRGTPTGPPVTIPVPPFTGITSGTFDRLVLGYNVSDRNQTAAAFRRFDLSYRPLGSTQKAADAGNSAVQFHPALRYNRYGLALAVWTDKRDGYDDLYGQLFDAAGNPIAANFKINDTTSQVNSVPSIASDLDGNFTVAFSAGDYTTENVRLQKVFSNGMPSGGNIEAGSSYRNNYDNLTSYIQTDSVRNALVCWWSGKNAPLYSRRFDAALTPSGSVQPIFNAAALSPMNILSVSANHRFDILVLWTDFMDDYSDYYVQRGGILKAIVIDENGRIIRDTMMVGVIPENKQFNHGTCRIDDEGNMLFVWTDELVGPGDVTVHTRRVYPSEGVVRVDSSLSYSTYDGVQIAKFEKKQALIAWNTYPHMRAFLIDDASKQTTPIDLKTAPMMDYYQSTNYHSFSADCHDNLLFTAFQKVNGERSFDIFAKVQFFGRTGDESGDISQNVPSVYPNPVGQSATFRYAFSRPTEAKIAVYNILGQKIADVVQGMKPAGQYTVQFPTRNLPAGVYFFVINGIKTSTTKFIVVK